MQDGSTVLIHAAANGHTDSVRLLLESGADMEAKNDVRVIVMTCSRFCVCAKIAVSYE